MNFKNTFFAQRDFFQAPSSVPTTTPPSTVDPTQNSSPLINSMESGNNAVNEAVSGFLDGINLDSVIANLNWYTIILACLYSFWLVSNFYYKFKIFSDDENGLENEGISSLWKATKVWTNYFWAWSFLYLHTLKITLFDSQIPAQIISFLCILVYGITIINYLGQFSQLSQYFDWNKPISKVFKTFEIKPMKWIKGLKLGGKKGK